MFTIDDFREGGRCDHCDKDADVYRIRCTAGTLDAHCCGRCLAKLCRLRAKSKAGATGAASPDPGRRADGGGRDAAGERRGATPTPNGPPEVP